LGLVNRNKKDALARRSPPGVHRCLGLPEAAFASFDSDIILEKYPNKGSRVSRVGFLSNLSNQSVVADQDYLTAEAVAGKGSEILILHDEFPDRATSLGRVLQRKRTD
jgi:hypothetical protein